MSVLITGSIAYDAVFSFAGAFGEQITRPVEPGFNTTFLTRAMRRDFGGCAGNIAVAMKRMGGEPLIWGAVGRDGGDSLQLRHLRLNSHRGLNRTRHGGRP